MFTPIGCFADVACPRGKECTLLKCLFLHSDDSIEASAQEVFQTDNDPPAKRLKQENKIEDPSNAPKKALDTRSSASKLPNPNRPATTHGSPNVQSTMQKSAKPSVATPAGSSRSAEPEPKKPNGIPEVAKLPPRQVPKEALNPRMLKSAPAAHTVRTAILKKLHASITSLNEKLRKEKSGTNQCFVLTSDEIITMALDEEEKCAREHPGVYGNVIKLRIVKLTKLDIESWVKEVMAYLNGRYYKINPVGKPASGPKPIETGLTPTEEIAFLPKLLTPITGLEAHGYVTKAPTQAEIEAAQRGVDESRGWEKCDRCGQRFQVFPGRRDDGTLTTGGSCTYHAGRAVHPRGKKTDHVTGSAQPYFPCCNQSIGASTGCTNASTHVFKVSEAKRLASILQFETTPPQPNKGPREPVSIDCEMGYTTQGLELIRLTAVSWPAGRDLLDVLVRPMGEILDFNTRFSGVSSQDFASAKPYDASARSPNPPTDGESKTTSPLQLVQSPTEARGLLLNLLQPETPLIGHAIENDLNVCRLIHPTIIDTVLLYPHPRGLPIRHSLKVLVQKQLGREIQVGQNGHDSKEDSIATGDLVRAKLATKWKTHQKAGWKMKENQLIPPPGHQ
ncbi:hypothetical protein N7541_009613 [Penicillium brevicompactum]|uniref:Exonuclease domain-containing protein n=1 Tax=Penicillium brevicompactum TaxID=5074 RepID=A0A9W9UHF9_PENBR|nr:hypothetical protein N7541_009613 [Penicillium brevicompactum]